MERNIPLLRKTMEHIEAHPDEWRQGSWFTRRLDCGTKACFAGTAILLGSDDEIMWLMSPSLSISGVTKDSGGHVHTAHDRARDLLGLTDKEASILFEPTNTMDGLRYYVDHLCA